MTRAAIESCLVPARVGALLFMVPVLGACGGQGAAASRTEGSDALADAPNAGDAAHGRQDAPAGQRSDATTPQGSGEGVPDAPVTRPSDGPRGDGGMPEDAAMAIALGQPPAAGVSVDFRHGRLKVASGGRYLVHEDGAPFFYLGDTAWELFHRLGRDDAEKYLENRRAKRFTVIQAVLFSELRGLNAPNANGDLPLVDFDTDKPNEKYFAHADFVIDTAAKKGLFVGVLPTWGDKVACIYFCDEGDPEVFSPKYKSQGLDAAKQRAYRYGKFVGGRWKDRPNVIWILGGDRNPDGDLASIWRELARGIKEVDPNHLMTFHPQAGNSSSDFFQKEGWLDFDMYQSGHYKIDVPNYEKAGTDLQKTPAKPTVDGEMRYENHAIGWVPKNGYFNDFDVRQGTYWSLFAGAHGLTYGNHAIWMMDQPKYDLGPLHPPKVRYWYAALDMPGAAQMKLARALMTSRPLLGREPAPELVVGGLGSGAGHLEATRGDGFAMIYTPYGAPVKVKLGAPLTGSKLRAFWFDPRTGKSISIAEVDNAGEREFDPPGEAGRGNDWILVLDDSGRGFSDPGTPAP